MLVPGLGARDFWAPDEPRFAEIGRQMLRSGDWIVPRMNGQPIALLPPLTYCGVALASAPAGEVTEATGRLAVVASAIIALLATYALGARVGRSPSAGLLAALVLGTSVLFVHQARWLQADMHLVAGVSSALTFFYLGYTDPPRRRFFYPLRLLACAFGTLAKGPLGAAAPGHVVLVYLVLRRDLVRGLLASPAFWAGVPLYAALVVPWYWLACTRAGDAFARELLWKHSFGMFFDTWSHAEPFWYYLVSLPWGFSPWIAILPASALWLARRDASPEGRRDRTFLATTVLALFLFYTISDAKQSKYILPIYPALSVMVALLVRELPHAVHQRLLRIRRVVDLPLGAVGGALALAGIAAVVGGILLGSAALEDRVHFVREEPEVARDLALPVAVAGAVGVAVGVAAALAARRGRSAAAFGALAAAAVVFAILVQARTYPAVDQAKSSRGIAGLVNRHAPAGTAVAIYGIGSRQHGGIIYYADRPFVSLERPHADDDEDAAYDPDDLFAFLRRGERVLCVLEEKSLRKLEKKRGAEVQALAHVVGAERVGHRRLVVLSNRPVVVSGGT